MKILTLAFITLISFTGMAQIPANCRRIEIHNNLSAEENYKLSGRLLIDHGWGIAYASADFFTIRTNEISLRDTHVYYNIASRDSAIFIYGMAETIDASLLKPEQDALTRLVPIENSRAVMNPREEAFVKMLEISNYFTGTKKYTANIDKRR